jgi:predicted anti-sigma-YlaC factor YlaD
MKEILPMLIPDDSPCRLLNDLRLAGADDADPATAAALAAHLETCPHCRQVDLDLASLLTAYRRRAPEPLGAAREDRLLQCMCGPAADADPADSRATAG